MFISIVESGELNLEDVDAMKSFFIVETKNSETQGQAINALKSIAEPAEDNHYWIDIDSVIELSPRKNDQEWVEAFWQMLKAAEPYGYVDMEKRSVKAHVEIK
ncbi:MAG: hypothetical protein GWP56_11685 [Gammaproteobacteria bacterium]|jgi:hypothetical protein|nr:hypothetical protein [Gammaproteobacteria bacterium]